MEEDQEEEKDKITTHAPQSLLAAILDDRGEIRSKSDPESKTEEVTGVQPVEERSSSMELQVVEERTPIAEDVVERSFRDSLEEPSVDQQKDNKGDRTDNEPVEPDSSHISQTADEPEESKAKELKHSTKRIAVKRPVAARKNKEIVYRQPSNRTYAAMHRTKVKVKQWGDERKVAETARKKGERQPPQNPEGYLDSFGASNDYVADTDWNSLNNSPRDYYGNDFRASSHATYTLGQAMDHPMQARYSDLNTNIHGNYAHPQPYEQREQASYYDRTYHSAVQHPQHSQLPPLQHSFASQSAPPGMYSHLRKPLLYQAECLPEEENHLSSTLSDSEFVETQGQMNKTPNSRLKRKFGSEPCLPYSTSTMLRKDLKPERTSYALGPRQTFDYKPYTLRDYRRVKEVPSSGLGGLGPNTETAEYKEKIQKVSKQKEYAEMLRLQHAGLKKHWQKTPQPPVHTTPQAKEGEAKRQAALNYAKSVPKPKSFISRDRYAVTDQHREENGQTRDLTLTEILRMRHEKEKNEVDAIRRELASKIRL